jgi:hypothetical protein
MKLAIAKQAVVQVSGRGRGFILSAGEERFVITAAHCVPPESVPTPHLANSNELYIPNVIGSLFSEQGAISAELYVYSLTDDIAVFGAPDIQELYDECAEYEQFTAAAMTIGKLSDIAAPPQLLGLDADPAAFLSALEERRQYQARTEAAFILSLDGEWLPCTVHNSGRFLAICDGADHVKGGMSGSPIINTNGDAIGLISTSGAGFSLNPSLIDCLPPWLLRKLDMAG